MKRSKQTIINRRIMHNYQQIYRLWMPIILSNPYKALLMYDSLIRYQVKNWKSSSKKIKAANKDNKKLVDFIE